MMGKQLGSLEEGLELTSHRPGKVRAVGRSGGVVTR